MSKEVMFVPRKPRMIYSGKMDGKKYFSYLESNHVIEQRVLNGWEYLGWLPGTMSTEGRLEIITLIFSRETEEVRPDFSRDPAIRFALDHYEVIDDSEPGEMVAEFRELNPEKRQNVMESIGEIKGEGKTT